MNLPPHAPSTAIILAAGQGTRMRSSTAKVLHCIAGRPLIHYSVLAAIDGGASDVVVVIGHAKDEVSRYLHKSFGERVRTVVQPKQNGTGDAARIGLSAVRAQDREHKIVIFYGDAPLIDGASIARITSPSPSQDDTLRLATCRVDHPFGYGRILRDKLSNIVAIREQKDLRSAEEEAICEINPGIYSASHSFLERALASLTPSNAQSELYLTDVVAFAVQNDVSIVGVPMPPAVLLGVNDRVQLAEAEEQMHKRIADRWRTHGVTVAPSARIDHDVRIESDATIGAGVALRGSTTIGARTHVDIGSVITNCTIDTDVTIKPYTVITESTVATHAQLGPFAHLRPGSEIGEHAHIGNFVETKKTSMGAHAKANHLAYLGDGVVGERVNVGAGTIFCNYDGINKHVTTIEAGAFIGSDSQLVAPVRIGAGAYVASGTTVVRDVPADALAISRAPQENKVGYAERIRQKSAAKKSKTSTPK